jgi:hypothetical protein
VKPPVFDYYDPQTLEEALDLLAKYGADAKIMAGGQSLMPLLNMRLARPPDRPTPPRSCLRCCCAWTARCSRRGEAVAGRFGRASCFKHT